VTRSTPFNPATDRGSASDRRLLHDDKAGPFELVDQAQATIAAIISAARREAV